MQKETTTLYYDEGGQGGHGSRLFSVKLRKASIRHRETFFVNSIDGRF